MLRGLYLALLLICACAVTMPSRALELFPDQAPKVSSPRLTDAERALVAGSRQAIVGTGISEKYFDRHFTLVKVVNQPGDRRVVWKLSVNGYETTVSDVLGFYTNDGRRIDTHSVSSTLHHTSDIEKTISRSAANDIMRKCIGTFAHPAIELLATGNEARLVFTAEAARKTARRSEKEEREREERERAAQKKGKQGSDVFESEEDIRPPIITGTVDLQSGKCTKGQLVTTP
ncbi:MAG TPA: hypothetical protein VN696_13085 [Pyrinomonadaceae bacterium]|nr:hypothetical protein [Pyrinomonadaceae bacterium]